MLKILLLLLCLDSPSFSVRQTAGNSLEGCRAALPMLKAHRPRTFDARVRIARLIESLNPPEELPPPDDWMPPAK